MKALQTRSPIHLYYDAANLASVDLSIWIKEDPNAFDTDESPNYQLTSEAINSQSIFEISELLRSVNQYEFNQNFYKKRDTAIYVLCQAVLSDSGGTTLETRHNFFRVRDGYVELNEQTQILNNNITPDIRDWSNNFNATITLLQSDPFNGSDAFKVEDTNDGDLFALQRLVNIRGVHTISFWVKGNNAGNNISLLLDNNNESAELNFNLNGTITSVDNFIAYDVIQKGFWFLVSAAYDFKDNMFLAIASNDESTNESFFIFNPKINKGNYINQSAQDLILQSNTEIFTAFNITTEASFDRKKTDGFYGFNSNFKDLFDSDNTRQSALYTLNFVDKFIDRVEEDGGTFESELCLINSLKEIGGYNEANNQQLIFDDLAGKRSLLNLKLSEICEPKYTPTKVSFINKFGVIQDLVFFKKRVDSYETSKENYKSNIITNGEVYSHLGQKRNYNKQAEAKARLSSGFYPQSFNTVFKQLLYSEMYWIDDEPAILTDSSWTEKTNVNDKLINYEFDFEYANDDINSIR
mgnify:CR=1 FL=1